MFELKFDTENAAFDKVPGCEIARILREVADQIDGTTVDGRAVSIIDRNGNHLGYANYSRETAEAGNKARAALVKALDLARSWALEVSDEKIDGEGSRSEYAQDMETIDAALKA